MFTHSTTSPTNPGPSNAAVSSVSASPVSTTPTRTSRLRGLSLLRDYAQSHLLSRDGHGSHHAHAHTNGHTHSSASTSAHSTSQPTVLSGTSLSTSAAASTSNNSHTHPSSTRVRLSQFVPALAHPLGQSPSSDPTRHNSCTSPENIRATDSSALPVPSIPPSLTPGGSSDTSFPPTSYDSRPQAETMSGTTSGTTSSSNSTPGPSNFDHLPSIRFSAFIDPRSPRPSLKFNPISRTLPTGKEVIRVGRYSEKENYPPVAPNQPSAAPVGFKSKVVSRRHCEFWFENGKWYIKDVKSSSGTFLNHIRLSPPGTESKPFPVNDGDIVQLGIDFKGGEEAIFRCVKMRLELNRGWQNKLNTFNMETHKRLRNLTGSGYSQDCAICLNSIACIKTLLSGPQYPIFICPNCRAAADLEAEVEDPEDWEKVEAEEFGKNALPSNGNSENNTPAASNQQPQQRQQPVSPEVNMTDALPVQQNVQTNGHASENSSTSMPIPINSCSGTRRTPSPGGGDGGGRLGTANGNHEGPITPRNDAGPWVFDGHGERNRPNSIAAAVLAAAARNPRLFSRENQQS
ncbi:uncharacterized protein CTHT_0026770 [Thermochaetoides thermophila DSM 1495]|uniref:FHA domain-containing protein n=1 Tax=Chaetomium thermophilum (strain DSM 1495 / CBS 144.50 / IMI 039719) TaxID=759272 RepID=G0S6M8_CHATD|nr:hypothetical protein CTHT_0026770 [Thermochaetoides thermophila DSM 1495]EGS20839.1 hypothetical protein CTHT_0026770 [Thermochaetoides thermophila DSM 1495]